MNKDYIMLRSDMSQMSDFIVPCEEFYGDEEYKRGYIPKVSDLTNCVVVYWDGSIDDLERNEIVIRDYEKKGIKASEALPSVLAILKHNGIKGKIGWEQRWLPTKYSAYREYLRKREEQTNI